MLRNRHFHRDEKTTGQQDIFIRLRRRPRGVSPGMNALDGPCEALAQEGSRNASADSAEEKHKEPRL